MSNALSASEQLAVLNNILDTFAGHRPIEEIDKYLHSDLRVHMDKLSFSGSSGWTMWARHSHATWPFDDLRFQVVNHCHDGDKLTVSMTATGTIDGTTSTSGPAEFIYRFSGNKVAEIWTSRKNYGYLYGEAFTTRLGFAAHMARMGWWNLRNRRD